MNANVPCTRRQRVEWLRQNRGYSLILDFAYKTDREVKRIFEAEYRRAGSGGSAGKTVIDPGGIADELSL